jgi:hypothetical protein
MEWFAAVKQDETFLTKEGLCEAVGATELGLWYRATDAFWETRQHGGRLQSNPLVHEFVFM